MKQNQNHIILKCPSSEKSLWQKKEPDEQSDPVLHEVFASGKFHDIILLAASIRGKSHAHMGKWREDAFCFDRAGSFLMMAAADGVGACPLSRIGAKIACETALESVKKSLEDSEPLLSADFSQIKSEIAEYVKNGVKNAVRALHTEAEKRKTETKQLSTTLMLALYSRMGTSHLLGTFQVGDGVVSIRKKTGEVSIFGKPDFGNYAGQSLDLTSAEISDSPDSRIRISLIPDLECMAVMTDGISDDFFPLHKGLPVFFEEMDILLQSRQPLADLKQWIRYEKTGSHDDRTLLLLSV